MKCVTEAHTHIRKTIAEPQMGGQLGGGPIRLPRGGGPPGGCEPLAWGSGLVEGHAITFGPAYPRHGRELTRGAETAAGARHLTILTGRGRRAGSRVVGREGFEPSTLGLRVPCSTN